MASLPVLPDFGVIARAHADLSRELSHGANLPALQGGNLILQEIRQMREHMGQMREEMGQMREEMQEGIRQTKSLIATR